MKVAIQIAVTFLLFFFSSHCRPGNDGFSPDRKKIDAAEINRQIEEFLSGAAKSADENERAKLLGKAAVLLAEKGDIKKAMAAAEEGLRSNPTNADCLSALGEYRLQMGRFHEAVETLDRSLMSDEASARTNFLRGNAAVAVKDRAGAESYYARALELEPHLAGAANNLASLYATSGRYDKALATIEDSLKAGATSAVLFKNAGIAAERLGQTEDARKYYAMYIEQNPYADDVAAVKAWLEVLQ